jgi:hypothetical protein
MADVAGRPATSRSFRDARLDPLERDPGKEER